MPLRPFLLRTRGESNDEDRVGCRFGCFLFFYTVSGHVVAPFLLLSIRRSSFLIDDSRKGPPPPTVRSESGIQLLSSSLPRPMESAFLKICTVWKRGERRGGMGGPLRNLQRIYYYSGRGGGGVFSQVVRPFISLLFPFLSLSTVLSDLRLLKCPTGKKRRSRSVSSFACRLSFKSFIQKSQNKLVLCPVGPRD